MNGEVYQLSRLVLYVNEMMNSDTEGEFKLGKNENRIFFSFAHMDSELFNLEENCPDALSWYKGLKKRRIVGIRLVVFFEENDVKLAGYSNASSQGIVTEYPDGKMTVWDGRWEFDQITKLWTVYYYEHELTDRPAMKYTFAECRTEFEKALVSIGELAHVLGFDGFAEIFKEACDILTKEEEPQIPEWMGDTLPALKGDRLRLFLSASRADVFGGMGSWNDSPDYVAHEKGLQEEYDKLSCELYTSMKKAIMNAVNG